MEGFYVVQSGEYIKSSKHKLGSENLLSKDSDKEIMLIEYYKGATVILYPLNSPESTDFYYILGGSMHANNCGTEIMLKDGDSFYIKDIKDTIVFTVMEDIKMLWITQEPQFDIIYTHSSLWNRYIEKIQLIDNYTAEHCVRVGVYTAHIAKKMDLPTQQYLNLLNSAALHDIGKIHIPEEILNKPSRLTDEEFDVIKRHTTLGYEMIHDVIDETMSRTILEHHERLDGRGYPMGLEKDSICLEAKIIAVADSYDAMTSDRPYRKGMTPQQAIDELKRCIGTHYEKEIVEKLEEALKEEGIIKGA